MILLQVFSFDRQALDCTVKPSEDRQALDRTVKPRIMSGSKKIKGISTL